MIQKEQMDLIGSERADGSYRLDGRSSICPVHPRASRELNGIPTKERKPASREASNEASHLQAQHKSSKAVFQSEPEERHDDHQVAFQVQSQQCCCKGHATRDTAKRERER